MALNSVPLNPGVGGHDIQTDLIAGKDVEVIKQAFGSEGTLILVDAAHPLPVTDAVSEAALTSIAAEDFSTHAAQIDGSQLSQIVDASGNPVTVTGNKLDVNATFSGDIEIGAVEIKNATTDDRTAVINTDPTTEFGLVTRNIPSGTQAVSAAALPLPTGAATAANQQTNAITDTQIRATPLPVSGTVSTGLSQPLTDTQLRATPVPVTNASLPLPTGAATSANQSTEITSLGSIDTKLSSQATAANQATEIASLASIDAGIPAALGQTTMANSMPVTFASDQSSIVVSVGAIDNTTLYSNTLAVTGAISGMLTTGYSSIIFSFSGVWVGNLLIEGSEDNSIWEQKIVLDVNEFAMQDVINENGIFQIKSSSKYIRINVLQVSGTITALIVGRTVPGLNAADSIAFAMDKSFNMPLYTQDITGSPLKDINNALILSDAPNVITAFLASSTAATAPIDTTGYQSASIQLSNFGTAFNSNAILQISNDKITWYQTYVYTSPNGIPAAASSMLSAALGIYSFPLSFKYFRVLTSSYTSGIIQVNIYLRQQPFAPVIPAANIGHVGGTAVVSSGLAGVLSTAGPTANAVAPTANPNLIAGIDTGGLTRRVITDTTGRVAVNINSVDQSGTTRAAGSLSPASNIQNIASLVTQEVSQFEGQSQIELLAQMLLELRIMNQYLSELPIALQSQNGKLDEPSLFRNEQSIFAN